MNVCRGWLCVGMIGMALVLTGCGSNDQPEAVVVPTSRPALAAATAPAPLPPPTKVGKAYAIHEEIDKHTTESGMEIQDVRVGDGPTPKSGDQVTVNYTGWLSDGKVFDSTSKTGQPFAFGLGKGTVIKGWEEGVATMKLGGMRILTIPPALGYGSRASGSIPANSTLVFEVELLGINGNMVASKPDPAATQPATQATTKPADAIKAATEIGPPAPGK
jgi:peptidylprolyl isomerase